MRASIVNSFLAHRQHLLPIARCTDVVQVTRDIVALHATDPVGPYLSLWARTADFRREALKDALYEQREMAKVLCMRDTLHVVPGDEIPFFFQAYASRRTSAERATVSALLVQAGTCMEGEAGTVLVGLHRRVSDVLRARGPLTVRQISQAVPELQARVRYAVTKPYGGEFSIGSRLVPSMCALGLLIRARPRGTWRSNLYEYAPLSAWLPGVDLETVAPQEAQAWLVRRYLSTFGPVTRDDVQWWTGFSKGDTGEALRALGAGVVEVAIEGWGSGHLMLADDAERLREFAPPDTPYVFFLPGLDPFIMGYKDRRRFLAAEHRAKVFDRAGNAVPTVWANGRVVGGWGQRKDGSVTYGLFEPMGDEERAVLEGKRQQLEGFLDGELLRPRSRTAFTRALK
jgi:hypothetical protein